MNDIDIEWNDIHLKTGFFFLLDFEYHYNLKYKYK